MKTLIKKIESQKKDDKKSEIIVLSLKEFKKFKQPMVCH